jgi:nucleoside-diphosphate-sugar epimerase
VTDRTTHTIGGFNVTILVTGATGRVGSRFVPRLLQQGSSVRILARDPARAESLERLGAEVLPGDLTDAGAVAKALTGTTAVVHLAAVFRGASKEEMIAVNQQATMDLARASIQAGVGRFVYVGTTLAYPAGLGRPAVETDELFQGEMAYPASKAAAEKDLMQLHRDEGLPLRVARLCFVYGEGDPHLAESLNWGRVWPLHQRLHLVHHADVSQALLRLAVADGLDGVVVNVGDDAPVTTLELFEINGEEPPADAADRTLDDPWAGLADTSRFRRVLGLRPIYPTVYTARDAGAL